MGHRQRGQTQIRHYYMQCLIRFFTVCLIHNALSKLGKKYHLVTLKLEVCFLVGYVALRPKSTAMVMWGWSVKFNTLFPGQA